MILSFLSEKSYLVDKDLQPLLDYINKKPSIFEKMEQGIFNAQWSITEAELLAISAATNTKLVLILDDFQRKAFSAWSFSANKKSLSIYAEEYYAPKINIKAYRSFSDQNLKNDTNAKKSQQEFKTWVSKKLQAPSSEDHKPS